MNYSEDLESDREWLDKIIFRDQAPPIKTDNGLLHHLSKMTMDLHDEYFKMADIWIEEPTLKESIAEEWYW